MAEIDENEVKLTFKDSNKLRNFIDPSNSEGIGGLGRGQNDTLSGRDADE